MTATSGARRPQDGPTAPGGPSRAAVAVPCAQAGAGHVRRTAAVAHEGVRARQFSTCWWCHQGVGDDMHLHHRVRRRDLSRDALWCGCVLVGLHARCHAAAHADPGVSVARGIIVPTWDDPRLVPIESRWPFSGALFLTCDLGTCQAATTDLG